MDEAIAVVDTHRKISICNQAFKRIVGHDPSLQPDAKMDDVMRFREDERASLVGNGFIERRLNDDLLVDLKRYDIPGEVVDVLSVSDPFSS